MSKLETDIAEIKTNVKWITGQIKTLPCKDHEKRLDELTINAARKNGACQAKEKIEQKQTGKFRFNWKTFISIMAILAALGIAIFK